MSRRPTVVEAEAPMAGFDNIPALSSATCTALTPSPTPTVRVPAPVTDGHVRDHIDPTSKWFGTMQGYDIRTQGIRRLLRHPPLPDGRQAPVESGVLHRQEGCHQQVH